MFLTQIFTWTQNEARQGLNDAAYFKVPFITVKTEYFPSSSSQVGYDFKISVSPVYWNMLLFLLAETSLFFQ